MGKYDLRYSLFLQIVTDYLALTLVVYTLGSIETPILLMIIPNTILATLFFTPRQSLLVAIFGFFMVISPLILEYYQWIPVISIYDHSFKMMIFSNELVLSAYIIILLSCVIFCWYLLCSITTKLIKNELDLECSYQDMIKLDEEKSRATLRSTHELKAPLAAIKNYVYTMEAGYAGEVDGKVLRIINRIGQRCDYLLNNVSDIIKLGNLKSYVVLDTLDEHKTQFHPINMKQYLSDFIAKNNNLTCEKELLIKFDNQLSEADDAFSIMANEDNLQLIFSNLLSNAINYSHPGGRINIVLSKKDNGNEALCCVRIEDQGIGIDENQLDKIFEEHFRANNAAYFYEGGTGLGLSIVKVCCQLLGAEIQINSRLNQGTSVTINFTV